MLWRLIAQLLLPLFTPDAPERLLKGGQMRGSTFTKAVCFLTSDCLRLAFLSMHIRHRCRNGPRLIKRLFFVVVVLFGFQQKSPRAICSDAS